MTAKQRFDWRSYVAQNTPGSGSKLQQERQQVMLGALSGLKSWYAQYGFIEAFGDRLKAGAYYGSVAMLEQEGTLLLGKYSGWLFALDACTDESPSVEKLEAHTRRISRPIQGQAGDPSGAQEGDNGLDARLAKSWEDINEELKRLRGLASGLDAADLPFCLSTFARETQAVVDVMAWEREQSLRFRESGKLPSDLTLDRYLEKARYSICLRAAASVALAFEKHPKEAWAQWQKAMDVGARVLRLVNDLAMPNMLKEFEEGKINAVSLYLLNRGWDGRTIPAADDPQLKQVVLQVREQMARELDLFSAELLTLPTEGPLAINVRASVAFTIAMYQHGDYQIPLEHGAF